MTEWIHDTTIPHSTDLWKEALRILEKRISQQNMQTWFQAISGYQFSDSQLTLMVPSKYYQDWMSSHFLEEISSAIEELTNQQISIQFKIDEPQLATMRVQSSLEKGEPFDY